MPRRLPAQSKRHKFGPILSNEHLKQCHHVGITKFSKEFELRRINFNNFGSGEIKNAVKFSNEQNQAKLLQRLTKRYLLNSNAYCSTHKDCSTCWYGM